MTAVRTSYRGDARRVARGCQPVINCGPDAAAFERWFSLPLMPGNQKQYPVSRNNRPFEPLVNCLPGSIEVVAMEIERPVGHHFAGAQAAVPAAIQGPLMENFGPIWIRFLWPSRRNAPLGRRRRAPIWSNWCRCRFILAVAGKRADGRRHPGPQLGLVRGQLVHGPPFPLAAGSMPGPWPTARPQSAALPRPPPRKCRSG